MKRVLYIVLDSVGCGNAPGETVLNRLQAAGVRTIGEGEISDVGRWIEQRLIRP